MTITRSGHAWVAMKDGIVGLLVLEYDKDHLLIENVAVEPAAQGSGIGSRLLAFADDTARRDGLPEVRRYTNAAMVENLAFSPRRGFVETHRARADGFDRVYFSKPVGVAEAQQ